MFPGGVPSVVAAARYRQFGGQSARQRDVPRLLHAGRTPAAEPRRKPGPRLRTGPSVSSGGAGQPPVHDADAVAAGKTELRGRRADGRHPSDVAETRPRVDLSAPGRLHRSVRRRRSTDPVLPDHQGSTFHLRLTYDEE